jgi:hypothetical protein
LNHFSTAHSSFINFPSLHDWFVSCETTHLRCNRLVKPSNNSDERHKIRCIGVNSFQIVPLTIWERYIALSYVWDTPLNYDNEAEDDSHEYTPSIRFPDLPQMIWDAIIATRALGEQYLWIDALCINQKDGKDMNE